MPSQALVLCQDAQVLSVLQAVLAESGIAATVCTSMPTAQEKLASEQFNPVIVDCDGIEAGTDFLASLRQPGPNFEAIALAIVRTLDEMRNAYAAGANLVLWKPATAEEAARMVRATQGLSSRRRRRFARMAMPALAYVNIEGVKEPALITELSEGGMGVQAFDALQAGRVVQLRFFLPGTSSEIVAGAEIAWADGTGRAGMIFTFLPETARAEITSWMSADGLAAGLRGGGEYAGASRRGATLKRVLARVLDAALVGGAVALFGLVYYLVTRTVPSAGTTAAILIAVFAGLWLAYRFVFFRNPARTPGALAAERICELYFDTDDDRLHVTPSR